MGCEQFFCRRQQQDNHDGRSSFEPARHGTEMVSPQAGAYIPSFTPYDALPDLPAEFGALYAVVRMTNFKLKPALTTCHN